MEKSITINNSHLFANQNVAKQQLNPGLYKSKSLKMKGENKDNNITITVWKDMFFLRIHQTLPEDNDEVKYWIPRNPWH